MVDGQTLNVLVTSLSLLAVTYIYLRRFSRLWMDEFRQSMFDVRDELFDYAASGKIDFNHPAYTALRSMMNGYIRFSHRMSALYFVLIMASTAFRNQAYFPRLLADTWSEAAQGLDPGVRADLVSIREKAGSNVLHYLFFASYTKKAVVVASVIGTILLVKAYFDARKKREELEIAAYRRTRASSASIRRSIDVLDDEAYACGKQMYAAA